MLPLEELKAKYIPIEDFPEKYNISVLKVVKLVRAHKVKYTEFKSPTNQRRRVMHVNPEDVLAVLAEERKE